MLSDRERSVLQDIESRLDAEDPELAERLAENTPAKRKSTMRYWLAMAILGLLLLISIGAELPIVTLVLSMAICGVLTHLYLRSRRSRSES